ncbi:hypothetical protein [Paenibacillus sp. FSL R5-0490]|uniref:hypothetical protein n=1 Tax=Paenibacillus sp. FSL R5-0490 TaxID=1920424 RepID=UPI002570BEF0|nr:hypothetical protein [Paenibacillus sp. FSL R5-0490]
MKKKLLAPVLLSSALLAGSIPVKVFAQLEDSENVQPVQASKEWNEKASVPLFVKERFAEKFSSSTPANALNYLKKHQDQTGIKNPDKNLKVKNVQKMSLA